VDYFSHYNFGLNPFEASSVFVVFCDFIDDISTRLNVGTYLTSY